jgi:hypothetical protein
MITAKNIQCFQGLDFESYKLLPQYNFSFLKNEQAGVAKAVKVTDKMILGSLVDAIRTGGKIDMAHKLYPHAKKIAAFLYNKFGSVLDAMQPQPSFTGELHYGQFKLPTKGRPDFLLPKKLIVDLKVMHGRDVRGTINYMRYHDQLFGYAKLAQVDEAYILAYSIPLQTAVFEPVPVGPTNGFWIDKIIKFGTPIDNA